jgi:hypothetical protein
MRIATPAGRTDPAEPVVVTSTHFATSDLAADGVPARVGTQGRGARSAFIMRTTMALYTVRLLRLEVLE